MREIPVLNYTSLFLLVFHVSVSGQNAGIPSQHGLFETDLYTYEGWMTIQRKPIRENRLIPKGLH